MNTSLRTILLASAAAFGSALLPAMAALSPAPGRPVAVYVPARRAIPAAAVAALAGGELIEALAGGDIVVARSPSADFVTRLYDAGAWLVLDARALAACRGALAG